MSASLSPTILALHDAAMAAHAAGRLNEAARDYRRVLGLQPDHTDALNNLSQLEWDRGDLASALRLSEAAVAAREHPRYLQNLGYYRAKSGDSAGAEAAYRRGLELEPDDRDLLGHLLTLLTNLERLDEAETYNHRLLKLCPHDPQLYSNLGGFAQIRGEFVLAEYHYRRALEIDPLYADACLNLASLGDETARPEMSELYARRALDQAPQSARARLALSHALLGQGRWAEAWADYEYRPRDFEPEPDFPIPKWRGEPLDGKRFVIVSEQGLGDVLQFARYGALLKARGAARVTLAAATSLQRLLAHMDGVDEVVDAFNPGDPCDFWAKAMSLPQYFGTTLDTLKATLPNGLPYIRLPPPSGRPASDPGAALRVGIFWAGGHHTTPSVISRTDSQRSLATDQILRLLLAPELEGRVHWTILQKDRRPDYLTALARAAGWRDPFGDADFAARADLLDTAEIIAGLDLVIGVDSALIHLSGALGRPTWMMDRLNHCWRWKRGASDSDWYPDVFRIFRQTVFGDWTPVLADVRDALTAMASPRSGGEK